MRSPIRSTFLVLTLMFFLFAGPARATPQGFTNYTDYSAYLEALGMSESVLDFDSLAPETVISDGEGETVDGITFSYPVLAGYGVSMMVWDEWSTTSSPNYLGTTDGGVFLDGDDFELSFASAISAIGMYFISADSLLDNDIVLNAGGASVGLSPNDGERLDDYGSYAYFLGIVDPTGAFCTASIETSQLSPDGQSFLFFYNVDDITTTSAPVPEPATMLLLGSGLVGLAGLRRRRRVK